MDEFQGLADRAPSAEFPYARPANRSSGTAATPIRSHSVATSDEWQQSDEPGHVECGWQENWVSRVPALSVSRLAALSQVWADP
jgi:hypothetical protein